MLAGIAVVLSRASFGSFSAEKSLVYLGFGILVVYLLLLAAHFVVKSLRNTKAISIFRSTGLFVLSVLVIIFLIHYHLHQGFPEHPVVFIIVVFGLLLMILGIVLHHIKTEIYQRFQFLVIPESSQEFSVVYKKEVAEKARKDTSRLTIFTGALFITSSRIKERRLTFQKPFESTRNQWHAKLTDKHTDMTKTASKHNLLIRIE